MTKNTLILLVFFLLGTYACKEECDNCADEYDYYVTFDLDGETITLPTYLEYGLGFSDWDCGTNNDSLCNSIDVVFLEDINSEGQDLGFQIIIHEEENKVDGEIPYYVTNQIVLDNRVLVSYHDEERTFYNSEIENNFDSHFEVTDSYPGEAGYTVIEGNFSCTLKYISFGGENSSTVEISNGIFKVITFLQ